MVFVYIKNRHETKQKRWNESYVLYLICYNFSPTKITKDLSEAQYGEDIIRYRGKSFTIKY